MKGKGFLKISCMILLFGVTPVFAGDTSDEITTMMRWWDDVGSDWEEAKDVIELAVDEPVYELANITPSATEEKDDTTRR